MIPPEFAAVREGDFLTVKRCMSAFRGGRSGVVVSVDRDGAALDFMVCGQCGNDHSEGCGCYVSIEHWLWEELEPP